MIACENLLAISAFDHNHGFMGHKRKPTAHQKQIRVIAIFASVLLIAAVVGMILMMNQPVGGYNWLQRLHHH
jgi:hypothetical protein